MGLTNVRAVVRNPFRKTRPHDMRLLVDSGASYSVLPEAVWMALRLSPDRTVEFELADGTVIERRVGQAEFESAGQSAVSPAVLGGPKDSALLGAVTLHTVGLTRDRRPLPMMMARLRT